MKIIKSALLILAGVLIGVVVLLISISRMSLGVHFLTDVLGGWLLGLVAIFLLVKVYRVRSCETDLGEK